MFITLLKIKFKSLIYRMFITKKGEKNQKKNFILYALLFGFLVLVLLGGLSSLYVGIYKALNTFGLDWAFYLFAGLASVSICVVGSIFLVYHEMYDSKDNDLLLSMPIKPINILMSRLSMVLILNYFYESLTFLTAYMIASYYSGFNLLGSISFIIAFLTLPLLSLAISCILSYILSFFVRYLKKYINIISIILFVVGFGAYMMVINKLASITTYLMSNGQSIASSFKEAFFPLYHMSKAIVDGDMLSLLIYLPFVCIPFIIIAILINNSFIKTASLNPNQKQAKSKISYRSNSLIKTMIMKDFKHYTSNAMLFLNACMGIVFTVVAFAYAIYKFDEVKMVIDSFPFTNELYASLVVGVVIALVSTNIISASSISIEGSKILLLKSLAIKEEDILKAKFLNHFILTAPMAIIVSILALVFKQLDFINTIYIFISPILYVFMIDGLGLLANLIKPRFDYLNDVTCVKQSMSVMITLLGSMALVGFYFWVWYQFGIDQTSIFNILVPIVLLMIDGVIIILLKKWGTKKLKELSL